MFLTWVLSYLQQAQAFFPTLHFCWPKVVTHSVQVYIKAIFHVAWLRNATFSEPIDGESTFELTGTLFFDREGAVCGYEIEAPSFEAMWHIVDPLRQAGFPSIKV